MVNETAVIDPTKRERSTVEFPYSDLGDAETIAKALHTLGGSVEWNTLAGQLKTAPDGGGFRSRMSGARMFGLLTWEKALISLTDLGGRICDPQQERGARVESFLTVQLYSRVYDEFNGKTLPPPSGLEALMGRMGVSSKQTERARQTFYRSAKLAGFFDFGAERLVKPAIGRPLTPPPVTPPPPPDKPNYERPFQESPGGYDPLIEGLLQRLPPLDTAWSMDARKRWLQAALNNFDVMYSTPEGEGTIVIEIKKDAK